jgi:Flp pilus assembly protein protease CpaA
MSAPLALLDLVASNSGVASDTLAIVSQVGIVLFAMGWLGAGWSLVAAQPEEGVLGPANS